MRSTSCRITMGKALAAAGLSLSLLAGLVAPAAQARTNDNSTLFITGGGSTFIQPLMAKWTRLYHSDNSDVAVNYQGLGSTAGINGFTNGLLNFGATDAIVTDAQMLAAGGDVLNMPMTLGPVAVTYNLKGLSAAIKLDGPTLANIYLGKITMWNDPAIAKLNPGLNLPSKTIVPVHRADGSGTTFIFTSYLSAVSNDWLGQIGPGATSVNWPTGQGGSKSPGVMAIVNQTPGAIGYVELSYAIALSLPVVSMLNKSGNYVAPSVAGAAADAAGAAALPADLRGLIVNSAGPKVYPITGFTWVIMHQHQTNASLALGMVKFLWWCIHTGQSYSSSGTLHYAPLPANIVKADEQKLLSVTVNGKQVYNGQ